MKVRIWHGRLQPTIVCSNDDLDLFYGSAKFGDLGFSMRKSENSGFFRNYSASDLKAGRCRQLIKFMKVCEY